MNVTYILLDFIACITYFANTTLYKLDISNVSCFSKYGILSSMVRKIANLGKTVPDAFHGTDFDSACKIISDKEFYPSNDEDDYLGSGVYFFEASRWHAKDWVIRKANRNGFASYAIIKAEINLGRCFDLNNFEHRKYLTEVVQVFEKRGAVGINDAVVINFFATQIPIDTVRANYVVPAKGKVFEGSRFYDYSCLMICVRNTELISNMAIDFTGVVI